jgi:ADP-ribosylglycohydrolase
MLRSHAGSDEVLRAIEFAQKLAHTAPPSTARVEELGGGWVAEEAISIALYSVLATHNFKDAVILAVNHSGDSDSTGSIAGNLAGAAYGMEAVPERWAGHLELRDEILTLADDLLVLRSGTTDRVRR